MLTDFCHIAQCAKLECRRRIPRKSPYEVETMQPSYSHAKIAPGNRLKASNLDVLALSILGLYTIFMYGSGRNLPYQREVYAATLAGLIVAGCLSLRRATPWALQKFIRWCAVVAVLTIPVVWQPIQVPMWVVGDIAVCTLPAIVFLVGSSRGWLFNSGGTNTFAIFHIVGALLAPLLFIALAEGDRYACPHYFLFIVLATWLVGLEGTTKRRIAPFLLPILLLLSLFSSTRSSIGLATAGAFLVTLAYRRRGQVWLMGSLVLGIGVLSIGLLFANRHSDIDALRRLSKLQDGPDESLMNRASEVEDALYFIEHKWKPINYLIGAGHGASFETYTAITNEVNFSDHGTLHNIHFGPALIIYRYGLCGIVAYVWIIFSAGSTYIRCVCARPEPAETGPVIFSTAVLLTAVNSLFFPVLPDATVSYLIAGHIYHNSIRRQRSKSIRSGPRHRSMRRQQPRLIKTRAA